MSKEQRYFRVPLSVLHECDSVLSTLETAVSCGVVSAGIGHRQELIPEDEDANIYDELEFRALLKGGILRAIQQGQPKQPDDISDDLWEAALVGAEVLDIQGGDRALDVRRFLAHHRPGAVFFTLRHDWMLNALYQARREAGQRVPQERKPLSWLEFRLLAALLSAKVNSYKFSFVSWESIQARACGYHNKNLLQAARAGLPAHCQPISRDIIRRRLDRMEGLHFFARCRYSTGERGGLTAYSFRHSKHRLLQDAVLDWRQDNHNLLDEAAWRRREDLATFREQEDGPRRQTKKAVKRKKAERRERRRAAKAAKAAASAPPPPASPPSSEPPAKRDFFAGVPELANREGYSGAPPRPMAKPSVFRRDAGRQSKTVSVGDALAGLFQGG